MAPNVIPAKTGIQFFRSLAWMPASAGMTNWVALVATYGAHVHLAHISPDLASPEGEGFQPSPKETLTVLPVYLLLIVLAWESVYLVLLGRGQLVSRHHRL